MRKLALFGVIVLLAAGVLPLPAQEAKPAPPAGQTAAALEPPPAPPGTFVYNSEGRRDPFKDLLGGRDVREKAGGVAETPIEDLILMGIIKSKKGFTAIVGTSQGFPSFVNVGDKFSDGYVLSINENQVVFRKTHERGIPLMRPRDIIKEITPEER